jgi:subtilisin family serine protease
VNVVRGVVVLLGAAVLGCAAPAAQIRPQMDPAPEPSATEPRRPEGEAPVAIADAARRVLPPEEAFRRGLMPLHSTGVPAFAAAMPQADGRGVLIAILDSGIDPSVPGLQRTTDGNPKILDLRDFSGEGRISLQAAVRRGDTILVAGKRLLGASRIASLAVAGAPWWGGVLDEVPLGAAPAADIDGNGSVDDRLPLVVVRTTGGWALFADTQGNGTLADDRPIRDYAVAREHFGWSRTLRVPSVHMAVNLADSAGTPLLDLVFDTSAHGTHVAGIAAGHDIYGVAGFDGVAPGARLLGIKIANDAQGGITTTRSMVRALEHAIRFAEERRLPLVVNISFGVGNEAEGTARIDAMVDSVLAAHPGVVVTVAAANDGPGLSTLGFPGSAGRILSIGASQPLVFNGLPPNDPTPEVIAPFSSRGGEIAGPDFIVPGTAYSTVPEFATGNEIESGTSMAAPYAAGLAARLLSATAQRGAPAPAVAVVQALRTASAPLGTGSAAEQGAGRPDLLTAWRWLERRETGTAIAVEVGGAPLGRPAIWITRTTAGPTDQMRMPVVTVQRLDSAEPLTVRLRSTAPWVVVPTQMTLAAGRNVVPVELRQSGRSQFGAIRIEDPRDGGLLAMLPVTIIVPMSNRALAVGDTATVAAGETARFFIPAEAGRGFQVEVATANANEMASAALHEPGGMPFRDGGGIPAGFGDGAALFELEASDVEAGLYEMAVVAGPLGGAAVRVTVRRAPVRLDVEAAGDSLRATATSIVAESLSVRLRLGMLGAASMQRIVRTDDRPVRVAVPVPDWAGQVVVDTRMARASWPRFTDFGVTFQDRGGRHIDASPMNYAFGRATPELPSHVIGDSLIILLAPAFANAASPWELDLEVRFIAEDVVEIDGGGMPFSPVVPRGRLSVAFPAGPMPRAVPAGFRPMLILVALEGDDHAWTREVTLESAGRVPR